MHQRWFWRMSRWARNPPSAKRVRFVLAIIAICLMLVAYEKIFGMPGWMELERIRP